MGTMHRLARHLLTLLAIVMLSDLRAQAGPISWSYVSTGGSVFVATDLMPPGGGHGILSLTGASSTTLTGSTVIPVISGSSFQIVEPGNGNFTILNERTGVNVAITDTASGLSGNAGWEVQVSGVPDAPSIALLNADPWNFNLGMNHYTITPVDGVTAQVEVSAIATPEPSSLILAILSLTSWSLSAYRRKFRTLLV